MLEVLEPLTTVRGSSWRFCRIRTIKDYVEHRVFKDLQNASFAKTIQGNQFQCECQTIPWQLQQEPRLDSYA